MMVKGEIDGDRRCPDNAELPRSDNVVILVRPHPVGQRETQHDAHRCQRPADRSQAGVTLGHVVDESGDDHVIDVHTLGDNGEGGVIAMTLVSRRLLEKQLGQVRAEPCGHGFALALTQWSRRDDVEEPGDEMCR